MDYLVSNKRGNKYIRNLVSGLQGNGHYVYFNM